MSKSPARVAIRDRGDGFIDFYIAATDTMDDAVLMLSARKSLLDLDRELFESIKLSLAALLVTFLESRGMKVAGEVVEGPAPGHERVQ